MENSPRTTSGQKTAFKSKSTRTEHPTADRGAEHGEYVTGSLETRMRRGKADIPWAENHSRWITDKQKR